jgi:hypothetical protein
LNSGTVDTDNLTAGHNFKSNYHGGLMQALYSQPHKMMEIRPGVALNESGKVYGGENYNITKPN